MVSGKSELSLWDAESGRLEGLQTPSRALPDAESVRLLGKPTGSRGLSLDVLSAAGDTVVFHEYDVVHLGSNLGEIPQPAKLWRPSSDKEPIPLPGGFPRAYSAKEDLINLDEKLWELQKGRKRPVPEGMKNLFWTQAVQDGRILGIVRNEKEPVTVWDLTSQKKLLTLPGAERHFLFSADGRRVAAKAGNDINVWDLVSGTQHAVIKRGEEALTPSRFSPDASWLITHQRVDPTHDSGAIYDRLWNIEAKPPREEAPPRPDLMLPSYGFSGDGEWLLEAAHPGSLPRHTEYKIYSVSNLKRPVLSLVHNDSSLAHPEFAADSRSVAGTMLEEYSSLVLLDWILRPRSKQRVVIKVWELPTARQLAAIDQGPPLPFPAGHHFVFMPHGKGLVTWKENIVEIWDIPPRRPVLVDYGLPVLFALLLLFGIGTMWSFGRRRSTEASQATEISRH